jgi:hypothetical protein
VKWGTTGATSAPKIVGHAPAAVSVAATAAAGNASCAASTRSSVVFCSPNQVAAVASGSAAAHTVHMSRPSGL